MSDPLSPLPLVIQGGMGVGVSGWRFASAAARAGRLDVFTDPRASPTGYPFKILELDGIPPAADARRRLCDLGVLRSAYRRDDGRVCFRCPGEPVAAFVAKGGDPGSTVGRRFLFNALTANVGLAQVRANGAVEAPLLTTGDEVRRLGDFLDGREDDCADEVLEYLLDGVKAA
jgi:NAD(P)H-dependent flavin oxidoreductase YrpB (nitropropane dioxygenase family)